MNIVLICPECINTPLLSKSAPLALAPVLGEPLLAHWMEHLAISGTSRVDILASDRHELVRDFVQDGARWGVRTEVHPAKRVLSLLDAMATVAAMNGGHEADDAFMMDHLPAPESPHLFSSYEAWFNGLIDWMPRIDLTMRVGFHEVLPGVWTGLRTHISPDARIVPPCWIGSDTWIEAHTSIGPAAIVEDRALVEHGARISNSLVGPETFVGRFCELDHCMVWGESVVDLRDESVRESIDSSLVCSLGTHWEPTGSIRFLQRVADLFRGKPCEPTPQPRPQPQTDHQGAPGS